MVQDPVILLDGRTARRRELNRLSIIRATQSLIADVGIDITAKDVAEHADLALKTLYNHFPTKQDMLHAAVIEAAAEFEDYLKERTASIVDLGDRAVARLRLHGRMLDTHPTIARVLVNAPALPPAMSNAMSKEASAIVELVAHDYRLTSTNHEMLLMVAFAATTRLTARRIADPSIGPESADELATWLISAFGLPAAEARKFMDRPLPAWPTATERRGP